MQKEEEKQNEMQDQVKPVSQDSNHHPPCARKIQLWSDPSASEYVICLDGESGVLAGTTANITTAQYTNLVEVDYLEDLKYDWKYTLKSDG